MEKRFQIVVLCALSILIVSLHARHRAFGVGPTTDYTSKLRVKRTREKVAHQKELKEEKRKRKKAREKKKKERAKVRKDRKKKETKRAKKKKEIIKKEKREHKKEALKDKSRVRGLTGRMRKDNPTRIKKVDHKKELKKQEAKARVEKRRWERKHRIKEEKSHKIKRYNMSDAEKKNERKLVIKVKKPNGKIKKDTVSVNIGSERRRRRNRFINELRKWEQEL